MQLIFSSAINQLESRLNQPIMEHFTTKTASTELYKEIDWITGFLPANSGQSGLKLQLKQLFQL